MPTYLGNDPLSALKAGNDTVTAAYAGTSQIFPNVSEITYWTGQEGRSSYPSGGAAVGTYTTNVTGPFGATFNLVGSNGAIGQTGLVKTTAAAETFGYGISNNSGCGTTTRTVSLQIVPTGTTTLNLDTAGGSFPATDTGANSGTTPASPNAATQSGSGQVNWTMSAPSVSGTLVCNNPATAKVTIGGQVFWTPGAQFTGTYTVGGWQVSPNTGSYLSFTAITSGSYLRGTLQSGLAVGNAVTTVQSGAGPAGSNLTHNTFGSWTGGYGSPINMNGTWTVTMTLGGANNYRDLRWPLFGATIISPTGDPCVNLSNWNVTGNNTPYFSSIIYP